MIPESELILNPDGTIYHLNLLPDHISDTILTVGDPARVAQVSRHFDSIEFEGTHREFVTHVGYYRGKRLTVLSTGMGTDNIDIVMNELDALVNIDFLSRTVRPVEERLNLRIIRLGTSGSLQADVPVGSLLATQHAIGLDSLMQFYLFFETGLETQVAQDLQQHLGLPFAPYVVRGSDLLREQLAADLLIGNTVTCPGFYGPQGRRLRLDLRSADYMQRLQNFRHQSPEGDFRLSNFEMETAGYYALGQLLGHEVLSLNAIVANRATGEFAKDAGDIVDRLIARTLALL
ncbi:phosphorylase [Hymenobacter sp. UV11]|uniref:nucleoside phosphorylase n=1 Tax=Hymenobacter sp. UV11 TaxID=1849735 RepID=UPI001060829F|nr:nucleoside phosphorylase [Hymenobacter sp. UV11]TDN40376.1 phosphorylase [Hymenobacter sp. UV11]TFZ66621.1 phosphorylase [Hymenobacter sp. UV11]